MRAPAQPRAAHAAAIQDVGKATLDHLTTLAHRLASDGGFQARPIGVDGLLGSLVAVPAQISIRRCRLGDARLPDVAVETLEELARMIAFIGHKIAGISSEESRVGNECVSTCRSRGSP